MKEYAVLPGGKDSRPVPTYIKGNTQGSNLPFSLEFGSFGVSDVNLRQGSVRLVDNRARFRLRDSKSHFRTTVGKIVQPASRLGNCR